MKTLLIISQISEGLPSGGAIIVLGVVLAVTLFGLWRSRSRISLLRKQNEDLRVEARSLESSNSALREDLVEVKGNLAKEAAKGEAARLELDRTQIELARETAEKERLEARSKALEKLVAVVRVGIRRLEEKLRVQAEEIARSHQTARGLSDQLEDEDSPSAQLRKNPGQFRKELEKEEIDLQGLDQFVPVQPQPADQADPKDDPPRPNHPNGSAALTTPEARMEGLVELEEELLVLEEELQGLENKLHHQVRPEDQLREVDDELPVVIEERKKAALPEKKNRIVPSGQITKIRLPEKKDRIEPSEKKKLELPATKQEGGGKSGALSFAGSPMAEALSQNKEAGDKEWDQIPGAEPLDKAEVEFKNSALLRGWVAAILLLGALGAAYLKFLRVGGTSTENAGPTVLKEPQPQIQFSDFLEESSYDDLEAQSVSAVRGFLDADSLEEASHYILGGEQRLEELVEFYSRPEERFPGAFKKLDKVIPNAIGGIFYFIVFATDQEDRGHQMIVVPAGDKMLVDWAASVGYGAMSVEEFHAKKPTTPVPCRFLISRDIPENAKKSTIFAVPFQAKGFEKSLSENPRYFKLSDLKKEQSFYARVSPEAESAMSLYYRLSWTSETMPVQMQLVWNPELGCPEVAKIERIWWFDYELVDVFGEQSVEEALSARSADGVQASPARGGGPQSEPLETGGSKFEEKFEAHVPKSLIHLPHRFQAFLLGIQKEDRAFEVDQGLQLFGFLA